MSSGLLYALCGALLFTLGLAGMLLRRQLLTRILGFNIVGSGVFLLLVGLAQRDGQPDPVPQAMVLTGIVVSVAATALALALARRLLDLTGSMRLPREQTLADEDETPLSRRHARRPRPPSESARHDRGTP